MNNDAPKAHPELDQFLAAVDVDMRGFELYDVADEWMPSREEDATPVEIFKRGFDLGRKAGEREVYSVDSHEVRCYFIGTVNEILGRMALHLFRTEIDNVKIKTVAPCSTDENQTMERD